MSEQATTRASQRWSGEWLGSALAGGALIAAGVALGLDRLDVVDVGVVELVWPVILVVVGATLLAAGHRLRAAGARWATWAAADDGTDFAERATAVFGEAHLTVSPRGGDDGRSDRPAVPVSAVAVLGSVEVRVPAGWSVRPRATSLLGEVKVPSTLASAGGEGPVVELHGLALLGSIEVVADVRQ